jgi:hypothetical protein
MSKFDKSGYYAYETPDPVKDVVTAIKATLPEIKSGWHSASIRFKLDENGDFQYFDWYKIYSFGAEIPAAYSELEKCEPYIYEVTTIDDIYYTKERPAHAGTYSVRPLFRKPQHSDITQEQMNIACYKAMIQAVPKGYIDQASAESKVKYHNNFTHPTVPFPEDKFGRCYGHETQAAPTESLLPHDDALCIGMQKIIKDIEGK